MNKKENWKNVCVILFLLYVFFMRKLLMAHWNQIIPIGEITYYLHWEICIFSCTVAWYSTSTRRNWKFGTIQNRTCHIQCIGKSPNYNWKGNNTIWKVKSEYIWINELLNLMNFSCFFTWFLLLFRYLHNTAKKFTIHDKNKIRNSADILFRPRVSLIIHFDASNAGKLFVGIFGYEFLILIVNEMSSRWKSVVNPR